MADFAGTIPYDELTGPSTTNPDVGDLAEPDYLTTWIASAPASGAGADTQPVSDEAALALTGNDAPGFAFLDFYNHIHISVQTLNLGNVVGLQEHEISIFNGYFVPRELSAVTAIGNEGLTLTEPVTPPYSYAPLQELIYTLAASTSGPPTIDATYTFEFDIGDYLLHVVGVRVVAWYWEANWINPVRERLSWKTDVLDAFDGSEQRMALTLWPRIDYEFVFDVADSERRTFENILAAWGARIWALPLWPDVWLLEQEALSGSSSIAVETSGRDFHVDGLVVLIGEGGKFESAEVETVLADSITVKRPLILDWFAGSRLYPARTARMLDDRSTARPTRNYARGLARFRTVEEVEGEVLNEIVTYRGFPVMLQQPNWRENPQLDYQRKIAERAFGWGQDAWTDESGLAIPVETFQWTMLSRADTNYFRAWCRARRGKQKALWLPTWSDDLVLATEVAPTATNIDVEACGLTNFAQADVHRRDIRIELTDGTVFYRRASGYVTVDEVTERMTIDAALGELVRPQDVERISWMAFSRLDTDSVELSWYHPAAAEATIVMRAPRNDV